MSQPENEFLSAKEWAAKEFWPKQPRCSGYEGGCDGDLPGEEHIAACPMHGKLPINFAEFAEAYAEYRLASRAPATTPRPGMMSAQEHVEKCCACNHGRSPCSEYRRLRDAEDSTLAGVERTDGQARSILDGVRIEQQTDTQKVAQAAVPGGKEPPALNINELDEKFPVRPEHKDMNEVLVGCANLLDTIKSEWGEAWSEWDQSVRNGITRVLLNTPPATHPLQDKPPAAPATTPTPECKECKEWKDTLEMYQNAWMREIGGFIVRKSHPIDGFVLRTRAALKEQYEKGKQDARDGWTGRDKWIEEVGQALGSPAQPSGAQGEEHIEITLLRSRLRTIHLAGTHGMSNREVADRVAELENINDQARQYIQNAQQREHRINELEAALAAAREPEAGGK